MKIQEYIKQNQELCLSDINKQLVYQRILSNINKINKETSKSWYWRFFYTKLTLWLSLVFVLWFLLYGNNLNIKYDTSNINIVNTKSSNIVYADSIAKIISFNGTYNIYHGTWILSNTDISNGDIIVIDTWSRVIFDINSDNYWEVHGPASFSINKEWNNKYFVNLKNSEYFKYYKKNKKSNSFFDNVFGEISETTISTNNYQIKWKNLDIVIAKKSNNEIFIKNNWEDIVVSNWSNQIKISLNKIAKLDSEIDIMLDGTGNIDQAIIDKINNPYIIISVDGYEQELKNTTGIIDKIKNDDNKVGGKIFVKKQSQVSIWVANNSWLKANDWLKIKNSLSDDDLLVISNILSYKNIQNTFDSISEKMIKYDRMYIQDTYTLWEWLARAHTKLWLTVNYYPSIYYIRYMANNLKDYLSKYDNIPNEYIYSLNYISNIMDQLNEKKPWDVLINNYNIVPEIINNDQKLLSGIRDSNWTGNEMLSWKELPKIINIVSWEILYNNTWDLSKDTMIKFKKTNV